VERRGRGRATNGVKATVHVCVCVNCAVVTSAFGPGSL